MRSALTYLLVGGVLLYAGVLGALAFLEPALVFPAPTEPLPAGRLPSGVISVHFEAADGTRLRALFWEAAGDAPTVLYFPGNGTDASRTVLALEPLREWGLGGLVLDYRGYGESSGSPSEEGILLDATAAWEFLTQEKGIHPGNTVLWGHSLGSGPATWLATKRSPRLLVLESAYTALPEVAARRFPMFPIRAVMKTRFPNAERLKNVSAPVLIAHSRSDTMIPFEHAEALQRAASNVDPVLAFRGGHDASALHDPATQSTVKGRMLSP